MKLNFLKMDSSNSEETSKKNFQKEVEDSVAQTTPFLQTEIEENLSVKKIPNLFRSESLPSIDDSSELPDIIIRRPNSRIIPQLTEIHGKMEILPNDSIMAKDPPEPTICKNDKTGEIFGLRCTCENKNWAGKTIVRCSKCGFFCHGECVGVARVTPFIEQHFICPFCEGFALRCTCGNNMKYDEPIIKCVICGYYTHKSCAHLLFGRNPPHFVCSFCGGAMTFPVPHFFFPKTTIVSDFTKTIEKERIEFTAKIPEGDFNAEIMKLLDKSELGFLETVKYLFNLFGSNAFDYGHEFWRTFVTTIANIFDVPKITVMDAIDELVQNFLYKKMKKNSQLKAIPGLAISDSILPNVMSEQLTKLSSMPSRARLTLTDKMTVVSNNDIAVGDFICSIPGLLCHQDEIRAEEGIPRTCIMIPGTPICIDVSQSTNTIVKHIRRSFNFNCVIKLQSVDGSPVVMMYATRARGPLGDERSSSGPAIPKGEELLLPFDTDMPYPVEKQPWKIKRVKPPQKIKAKSKGKQKVKKETSTEEKTQTSVISSDTVNANTSEQQKETKVVVKPTNDNESTVHKTKAKHVSNSSNGSKTKAKPIEANVKLTLLSSFTEDGLSPIPIIIKNDENDDVDIKLIARQRHKSHVLHKDSDQEN